MIQTHIIYINYIDVIIIILLCIFTLHNFMLNDYDDLDTVIREPFLRSLHNLSFLIVF